MVIAVHVLPDVFDDLWQRQRRLRGRLDFKVGGVLEIPDERAVETIEDDELGLVDPRAFTRVASEHLHPEDARLDRAQEDDELQRGNVHAGGEHVHGDDDLGIGAVAEFADALERAVHVRVAGDFLDEVVALAEHFAAGFHQLIGVRGVRDVVDGEDENFWKMAGRLLVRVSVLRYLLDDFPIALRRGDAALDVFGGKLPLVLQFIPLFLAGGGVNVADFLALFEKRAVHAHVGFDGDGFVVHQEAIEDGLLNIVAEHRRAKQRRGVRCRRGREANLDGVEMRERVAPETRLLQSIAAMTFVRDDEIKGVNRNVELVGGPLTRPSDTLSPSGGEGRGEGELVNIFCISTSLREATFRTEQIPRHALDGRDVNERVRRLGIGQVLIRQHLGIERLIVAEILLLKLLAINFVFLRELVALVGVEGIEGADGLRRERLAIHEKEDTPESFALQQPINLGDGEECFAGAGGHGDEQPAFAGEHGRFHGNDGPNLIWAQAGDSLRRRIQQPLARLAVIAGKFFGQSRRGVKIRERMRCRPSRPDIQIPDDFAIGGVKERDAITVPIAGAIRRTARITLGLLQDVLRIDRELLGLDDSQQNPIHKQGVVGGAILRGIFFNRDTMQRR